MSRFLCITLIPSLIIFGFAYKKYLLDSLPPLKIKMTHDAKISINKDKNGFTSIKASTDLDVYYATGYAHAQDRLWQLELQRRIAKGTLSEIFGKATISQDLWIRTTGIKHAAQQSLKYLSAKSLASLDAYAAGINAYLTEKHQLPIEFSVLGLSPEPWENLDSLLWSKVFALSLAGNYRTEIQRFVALKYLTPSQVSIFFPEMAAEKALAQELVSHVSIPEMSELLSMTYSLAENFHIGGRNVGSNAWVVSGSLTKSGNPILANDPHVGLSMPSMWYAVEQLGEKLNVTGFTLVGLPVVIFGKNKSLAWGGTSMQADVQDTYLEQVNPHNPNQYWSENGWKTFNTRTEFIKVRADFPDALRNPIEPVQISIRETERGPVISDALGIDSLTMSLQWTGLNSADTSYEALYQISYAQTETEFLDALSLHIAPTLNIFYADTQGNIGFHGIGQVPIRNRGEGILPSPINDGSYYWKNTIPFSDMPQIVNPKSGYIHNANNKNVGDDYPYFISHDFVTPYRANRIASLIEEKSMNAHKLDTQDMMLIQGDVKDLSVAEMVSLLSKVEGKDTQQKLAIEALKAWQGIADVESVGATIYYNWLRHLREKLFSDELKGLWNKQDELSYLRSLSSIVEPHTIAQLINSDSLWCDDINTTNVESCEQMLHESLQAMLEEIASIMGDDIADWKWGGINTRIFTHSLFSQTNGLKEAFERKLPTSGSENTLNVVSGKFDETKGYLNDFGAGFRQIMELSDTEGEHYLINSTGQSGQIGSPFYDNMIEIFSQNKYIQLSAQSTKHDKTSNSSVETK
ncbi:MAG: penicillin amidase [Francisellaceae bacterium]